MSRRFLVQSFLCLVGVVSLAAFYASSRVKPTHLTAGAILFTQSYPDLQGQLQPLKQWQGERVVINFWATWCASCVKEIPEWNVLHNAYPAFKFLGLGVDTPENIRKFVQKTPMAYPVLVAGMGEGLTLMRAVGNRTGGLPFTLIVNRRGEIEHRILGPIQRELLERLERE